MAKETKTTRADEPRKDRTRDRTGWKAARADARKAKGKRREFETGDHR